MAEEKKSLDIVIAQTNPDTILEIGQARREMYQDSKNNVICTCNPGDVLGIAAKKPIDIVITGQRFYRDFTTPINNLKAIKILLGSMLSEMMNQNFETEIAKRELYQSGIVDFRPPVSGPDDGTDLADMIRRISPETLVFRYSLTPDMDIEGRNIMGDIPKATGWVLAHKHLLDFIESPKLYSIVKNKDYYKFKETFPWISFYDFNLNTKAKIKASAAAGAEAAMEK